MNYILNLWLKNMNASAYQPCYHGNGGKQISTIFSVVWNRLIVRSGWGSDAERLAIPSQGAPRGVWCFPSSLYYPGICWAISLFPARLLALPLVPVSSRPESCDSIHRRVRLASLPLSLASKSSSRLNSRVSLDRDHVLLSIRWGNRRWRRCPSLRSSSRQERSTLLQRNLPSTR